MPADPTHYPPFRRTTRKLEDLNDVEARRARGEISCAECRRLKLKCDRQVPCGSCTRRNCQPLCPNRTSPSTSGARSALADSVHLQSKITEMEERIRELESALAASQAKISNEAHPLIKEGLPSIKSDSESVSDLPVPKPSVEGVIDALGTMSIGERGEGKYFGRSAGAEMLLMAGAQIEKSQGVSIGKLPPELASAAATFPFSGSHEVPWEVLFNHLPPEPRAWTLCETYAEHSSWKLDPIRRDQLVEEVLAPIYKALKEHKSTGVYDTSRISPHHFAVLFLVFAIGAALDLTLEPVNDEAFAYYNLGRSALSLRSIFDSQDIICVQAVMLMAHFKMIGSRRYTMDSSWYLSSMAVKLAQGLGLHRDSSKFRMNPKIVQRRRHLFWELFSMDLFSSLLLGRPPTMRLADTDCEFPDDDQATIDEHGNTLMGFTRWKYGFTKEVFAPIVERILTAEAPTYQTFLELDRMLREKAPPPHLNSFIDSRDANFSTSNYLKRCLLGIFRSHLSIYLHRSFCIQAMLQHPKNPLQSPFAPSYLAIYQCASHAVKASVNHFEIIPELCCRLWSFWIGTFSAAVILGAIIIRTPTSSMAPPAFVDLGLACDLFEKGVKKGVLQSDKGRAVLDILNSLRSKALHAYSNVSSGRPYTPPETGKLDGDFDELALFGGQIRILVCQWLTSSSKPEQIQLPTPRSEPSPSMDLTAPSSAEFSTPVDDLYQVHPALVDYISAFSPPDIGSLQTSMGVGPTPNFNYAEQDSWKNDPSWANYIALSGNESFVNIGSDPSILSKLTSPTSPVVATGTEQLFLDEPWTVFQNPDIFQLGVNQPHFMDGFGETY